MFYCIYPTDIYHKRDVNNPDGNDRSNLTIQKKMKDSEMSNVRNDVEGI